MIDKIDKKILFELDRNCRIPDTQLAKIVGRSKESVRYRIKQLVEKGIITGFHTWIDPTKLGYNSYKIYLKLANIPEKKQAFINLLKKEKRLFWLGVADGAWDLGLTFFDKNNLEFYKIQNELVSKFKDLILKKQVGVLVNVTVCTKDFLLDTPKKEAITMFTEIEQNEIDDIDKKILRFLFNDARISLVDLAKQTGVSIDIIRSRKKKLEEKKIIVQYKASIDYNKLGYEFYKTFLYFNNLSEMDQNRIMEYIKQHPNILHMIKQISPWDMELEIMVKSYQEYNKIINNLKKEFANIILDVESAIMSEDHIFPAEKMVFE